MFEITKPRLLVVICSALCYYIYIKLFSNMRKCYNKTEPKSPFLLLVIKSSFMAKLIS